MTATGRTKRKTRGTTSAAIEAATQTKATTSTERKAKTEAQTKTKTNTKTKAKQTAAAARGGSAPRGSQHDSQRSPQRDARSGAKQHATRSKKSGASPDTPAGATPAAMPGVKRRVAQGASDGAPHAASDGAAREITAPEIAALRLRHQHLIAGAQATPAAIVHALGAVQAQDYAGGLWAVGLRTADATEAQVEQAIADRAFVRSWPLRGTLHFVSAADVRWMLALKPARLGAAALLRRKQLELDARTLTRARSAAIDALRDGPLTREALYAALESAGIATAGGRGLHIIWELASDAIVCFAPRRGKQQMVVLLDDWLPAVKPLARDEALAALAWRYFSSRGPATLPDFVWWSGLAAPDARAALDAVRPRLIEMAIDGRTYWMADAGSIAAAPGATRAAGRDAGRDVGRDATRDASRQTVRPRAAVAHLLPPYDEYTVAYKDRGAAFDAADTQRVKYGIFGPALLLNGRIVGAWKRTLSPRGAAIEVTPFAPLAADAERAVRLAVERYTRFLALPATITIGA